MFSLGKSQGRKGLAGYITVHRVTKSDISEWLSTHSRLYQILKLSSVDKIEGKIRRGQKRIGWLNSITHSMGMNLSKLWETVKDRGAWHPAVHGVPKSHTQLKSLKNSSGQMWKRRKQGRKQHRRKLWTEFSFLCMSEANLHGSYLLKNYICHFWKRNKSWNWGVLTKLL